MSTFSALPRLGRQSSLATDPPSAAQATEGLITTILGTRLPIRFAFWDGNALGPPDGAGTVHVRSVDALRRVVWSPDELGVSRAYVAGDLDIEGDVFQVLESLRDVGPVNLELGVRAAAEALVTGRKLGALGKPLPPPPEEARPHGWRHSRGHDAQVINHHYDVSNDFYRLVLGPAMTYSCARFVDDSTGLEAAQAAKHELICRKLGLPHLDSPRLLDVGCGWGSLAIHAAREHGARVVGVTISRAQAELARKRVAEAGMADLVEIRLQDYRDVHDEPFDAISSVGMFEHVGAHQVGEYFAHLRPLLAPRGRFLNHAISSVDGSHLGGRSFMGRYVFPDADLIDVGRVVLAMEHAGFEVRDVESLREHYAKTLRAWVANLEQSWDDAVELVGEARARIWRLYMAGSAIGFEDGGIAIHQVLGVATTPEGDSAMPPTRRDWD